MDAGVMLALRGAGYRYPGAPRDALVDVSVEVRPGELHALLGPNGSGKTTLLRLALGIIAPTAGAVEVEGRPAADWERRALAANDR